VLPVTDSVLLAKDADATLLIVAAGQTSRGDLQRAAEKLAQVNAQVVGLVLNETTRQGGSYGYGYGYGGTYATDKSLLPVPAQLNGSEPVSHRGGSRRTR
jgi:polysaccharide biosynthesis transport protein